MCSFSFRQCMRIAKPLIGVVLSVPRPRAHDNRADRALRRRHPPRVHTVLALRANGLGAMFLTSLSRRRSPGIADTVSRGHHVTSSGQEAHHSQAHVGGCRRALAPCVRLRPTSDYDPFLLLDDFRNDVPADTSRASRGIPTAASRPSRTSLPVRSSTPIVWETGARSQPATFSG